jgi:Relaxase/Mobilisation nuclease domain
MIVKISSSGTSFKGLAQYLTHDPQAETSRRVAWTHTHNLANDDVPCAVNEMYLTAENAELLKQEAGIRAGGRKTQNTVKHISLNWAPTDNPSQKHMTETAQHFIEFMGWGDHQAIFVAHDDKAYKHVHLILNATHPETGRHLKESWEQRRASDWAAEYERAQGYIRCPQRLQEPGTREKSMPRNMWVAFQQNEKSFLHGEELLHRNSENELGDLDIKTSEWRILKDIQQAERLQFIAEGKQEFSILRNSIYRTVREEFRGRWNDYYQARRNGANANALKELKQGIIAEQKAALEPRRDTACKELRASRDAKHQDILDMQRDQRQALRWHQDLGLDTSDFFHELRNRHEASLVTQDFRETARQVTQNRSDIGADGHPGHAFARDVTSAAERPVTRAGSFGASLLGSLVAHLTNLGSAQPEPKSKAERDRDFSLAAAEETKQREKTSRALDDEDSRQRSKVAYGRE